MYGYKHQIDVHYFFDYFNKKDLSKKERMRKIKKGKKYGFIKFVLIRLFVNSFIQCISIMMSIVYCIPRKTHFMDLKNNVSFYSNQEKVIL